MKSKLILSLILFITIKGFGQQAIPSSIQSVKVYLQNAEITRKANISLKSGRQSIVLTGISTAIDPASLQVKINNSKNATLLSAKYERNYLLPQKQNPKVISLQKSLDNLSQDIAWIAEQKQVLKGMSDILNKNQDLGGKTGFTPNQVIALTTAYKNKMLEIKKEEMKLSLQEKKKQTALNKVKQQLQELKTNKNKPSGNIVLQFDAATASNIKLKCQYLVSNAGWKPAYDLRSEGIQKNVKLYYKANVYQQTGQDWKNVQISISTGNPSRNNNRPILSPLYVHFAYLHQQRSNKVLGEQGTNMATTYKKDKVSEEYEDAYQYNSQQTENQLSIVYKINNKQNINSDGKSNLVALKTYEMPTKYVYHSVPKLDQSAFLLAKISQWSKYNLISGKANIFFEGAYVGKTYINSGVTSDTLLLSMGRDASIVVQRKTIDKYTKTQLLSNNKKVRFGYEINIKNKKNIPIEIEILDQIPVSQNNKIDVALEENSGAEYTENIGKILWKLKILPRKSKKVHFIYTVKYPKKQTVIGLK